MPRLGRWAGAWALGAVLVLAAAQPSAAAEPRAGLWALAPGAHAVSTSATVATLRGAAAKGIGTVLVDRGRLSRHLAAVLRRRARRAGLRVIPVVASGRRCSASRQRCARLAPTVAAALRFARQGQRSALYVRRTTEVRRLARRHAKGRIMVVVALRRRSFAANRWRSAIDAATASRLVELAVDPQGPHAGSALRSYLDLLTPGTGASGPPGGSGGSVTTGPPGPVTTGPPGPVTTGPGPQGGPTPPTPAPALPPASVFLSPSGSDDSTSCSQPAPCKTFSRAYQVANPGDVVEVAGGEYPDSGIAPDPSRTSAADVVFRPAAGATVHLDAVRFTVDASHVELRDMSIDEWWTGPAAHDVTMRGIHAQSFAILSEGSDAPYDISVIGGDYGPVTDWYSVVGTNGPDVTDVPHNVLIDGVHFHDYTLSSPTSAAHVECLQVWGADGLVIRHSTFRNCWVFDILFNRMDGSSPAPTPTNILVENNFFECCGAGDNWSVRLSDTHQEKWANVTIRNNSTNRQLWLGEGAPYSNVNVLGNVGPYIEGPSSGVTYDYNVWYHNGTAMGPHDRVVSSDAAGAFVDPAAGDLHLRPGGAVAAAAVDHGEPSGPADDIDHEARPRGAAPDAGADEAG